MGGGTDASPPDPANNPYWQPTAPRRNNLLQKEINNNYGNYRITVTVSAMHN